jgi:hypothetical protein
MLCTPPAGVPYEMALFGKAGRLPEPVPWRMYMSLHAAAELNTSSPGSVRTTSQYLSWSSFTVYESRPRRVAATVGILDPANHLGPGKFESGWKNTL